jgi:hypothetical protein
MQVPKRCCSPCTWRGLGDPGRGDGACFDGEGAGVEVIQPLISSVRHGGRLEQNVVQPRLKHGGLLACRWLPHPAQHTLPTPTHTTMTLPRQEGGASL